MRFPLFLLLPLALAALSPPLVAAERVKVWIALRDKGPGVSATPARAFEDAPVHAPHLARLRDAGVEIVTVLKWQNRVSGWVDADRMGTVAALSCVRSVEEMPLKALTGVPQAPQGLAKAAGIYGEFDSLMIKTGAAALCDTLAARGLRAGEGVRIAVMDADFLLGHRVYDSLFADGRIVDQHDFVAAAPVAVSRALGSSHGATVLSLIAADWPGSMIGLAPKAQFLLYRTEDAANEQYVEEDYLAAALERAVDSGAQVINVSLSYRYDFDTEPNIPYAQMDGRTRPSSLAALGAARRGALVVVAIGNEGISQFGEPTVTAPSDADSILAVGMITAAGARCSYSGTGPSFDGRTKPELSSLGCAVRTANPATDTAARNESGTSVGAPVIAGIAALLRQLHPDSTGVDGQAIRLALTATASRAQTSDNLVGSGLVRAAEAHCALAFNGSCAVFSPPLAVKGMYVWRGGNLSQFPWPNALNTGKIRAWDMQGRMVPLQGQRDEDGNVLLQSRQRKAPSPLILKIPVE